MRIRIGIGRPEKGTPRKHVLDIFNAEEREIIETTLSTLTDLLDLYISTDSKRLLDAYSKTKLKPIPSAKDGINRPKEDQHD
jgi:peptidyl-tRNA hydrolase